jgi:hypothetical protein
MMALWFAQPALQLAVAIVVWRRQLYKQFPVFLGYLLTQIVIFAITYPIYETYGPIKAYFWLYWLSQALNAVLSFKIIHEIFLDVFRPYHALKDLGTPVFKWAGLVMLLVSVVVAASNSFEQDPIMHAVTTLQRSVRLVQVGLILFLILFSRFLGVSRKQVSFGVALGFGVFAGVELMLLAMHSGGMIGRGNLNLIDMMCYNISVLIWFGYSFSRVVVARDSNANYLQTNRWEQGLADLQTTESDNSLIPMFEGMVERAFSRSSNLEDIDKRVASTMAAPPSRAKSAAVGAKTQK